MDCLPGQKSGHCREVAISRGQTVLVELQSVGLVRFFFSTFSF